MILFLLRPIRPIGHSLQISFSNILKFDGSELAWKSYFHQAVKYHYQRQTSSRCQLAIILDVEFFVPNQCNADFGNQKFFLKYFIVRAVSINSPVFALRRWVMMSRCRTSPVLVYQQPQHFLLLDEDKLTISVSSHHTIGCFIVTNCGLSYFFAVIFIDIY